MTYWIRPLYQHLKLGMIDGNIENPYPEESYAGRMWRAGNAYHYGTPEQAFEALADAGKIQDRISKQMPTAEDLQEKIGIPFDKWVGNCAAISAAVLPHLYLDKALCAYGFYSGRIAPGTHFANSPIVRHGWIETLDGLVIDPTRWVFDGTEPQLFVGSIADYDYGMMRYKAEKPLPDPIGAMKTVAFPAEQADFISRISGVLSDNGSFTFAQNQFSWLADRPIEIFREHFIPILDILEENRVGWITEDAKNWRDANRPIMHNKTAAAA